MCTGAVFRTILATESSSHYTRQRGTLRMYFELLNTIIWGLKRKETGREEEEGSLWLHEREVWWETPYTHRQWETAFSFSYMYKKVDSDIGEGGLRGNIATTTLISLHLSIHGDQLAPPVSVNNIGLVRREVVSDTKLSLSCNGVADSLSTFADKVTRVATEVERGKIGGQVDVRGISGMWKDMNVATGVGELRLTF
ncbi:hypothetical protein DL96DRAFT_1687131 [Flagelloscypha sp. PMI_526]|nr:hypothetical protein DL96DRAFT_1687131 [Flagelloscypha sp. PMI_526]